MLKKFIPNNFKAPSGFKNERILLRKISINDAEKDYEAVMSSVDHIKGVFGNEWPPADLTFDEELMSLKLHIKDMDNRLSFTYTVLNLPETKCLGCVYLYPSHKPEYDAIIFLWVRQDEIKNGLDEFLFSTVKKWIKEKWPFKNVAYPGRKTAWDELEIKPNTAVGALIFDDQKRILLQYRKQTKYHDNCWFMPCGKTEDDEEPEEAIIREVKEETSLDVEIVKEISRKNNENDVLEIAYECKIINGTPKNLEPDNFEELKYFSLNNLPKDTAKIIINILNEYKKLSEGQK